MAHRKKVDLEVAPVILAWLERMPANKHDAMATQVDKFLYRHPVSFSRVNAFFRALTALGAAHTPAAFENAEDLMGAKPHMSTAAPSAVTVAS